MKTTVAEVCALMEAWAPSGWACSWDKVGLQTGRPDQEVTRILVCLTITPAALAAARRAGASMIVAHHPLIWDPLKNLRTDDPQAHLCVALAAAEIACFVAHTNLDVAPGGVNDALARKLGLLELSPLFPQEHVRQVKVVTFVPASHLDAVHQAMAEAGAGVIGDYQACSFNTLGTGTFVPGAGTSPFTGVKGKLNKEPEWRIEMLADKARVARVIAALRDAHPYEAPAYDIVSLENVNPSVGLGMMGALREPATLKAFAGHVCKALRLPFVQVYGPARRPVRQVAVLGGSGGDQIPHIPDTADVYVSGDIRYHDAHHAQLRGLACIDAGHAGTELPVLQVIAQRLRQRFHHLRVTVYRERPLPTPRLPD